MTSFIDPEVRELLVCPRCRGELEDREDGLWCPHDRLLYPVVEGVPYMIEELAERRG